MSESGQAVARRAGSRQVAERPPEQSFERLVQRYEDRVYSLALRLLGNPDRALDVTQETFVRALQGLQSFRRESSFSTWLCRITINLCYSERRRDGRRRLKSLGDVLDREASQETRSRAVLHDDRAREPFEASQSRELSALVQRAIAALDDDLRFVVVLRDLEQLSYEEVATALAIPVGTVRSRLHRARERLRCRLRPWLEEHRGGGDREGGRT
jgi:RNA polymerase sigma-70 factor (ECF subfamily)